MQLMNPPPPLVKIRQHKLLATVESKRVLFQETTLIVPEAMLHLKFHDNPWRRGAVVFHPSLAY